MTDKDVIKALECCSSDSKKSCKKCPYVTVKGFCYNKLEKDAIALLNQQQIEIERLKKGWKADVIETQNIKAEAIKEFAERLKKMSVIFGDVPGWRDVTTNEMDIDNLVKEMVGDDK